MGYPTAPPTGHRGVIDCEVEVSSKTLLVCDLPCVLYAQSRIVHVFSLVAAPELRRCRVHLYHTCTRFVKRCRVHLYHTCALSVKIWYRIHCVNKKAKAASDLRSTSCTCFCGYSWAFLNSSINDENIPLVRPSCLPRAREPLSTASPAAFPAFAAAFFPPSLALA